MPIEIGLLLIFLLHVYKAVTNYVANQAARPVGYAEEGAPGHTSRKSVASSTMIWSGLVVLLFIVVHVKQFKFGTWYETGGDAPIRDLSRTEVEVFRQPLWVAFYVVAHAARRPAPAPRHLERLPVARPRPSASTRGG